MDPKEVGCEDFICEGNINIAVHSQHICVCNISLRKTTIGVWLIDWLILMLFNDGVLTADVTGYRFEWDGNIIMYFI
jgi:hypothetical protein